MNGYLTPIQAFKAARDLHADPRLEVTLNLRHARGMARYRGDDDRQAGRTATIVVEVDTDAGETLGLDELVKWRARILELGYRAEYEHGSRFAVLGPV